MRTARGMWKRPRPFRICNLAKSDPDQPRAGAPGWSGESNPFSVCPGNSAPPRLPSALRSSHRQLMSNPVGTWRFSEDVRADLLKDGGRTVMYGGDPYEDDLEPVGLL